MKTIQETFNEAVGGVLKQGKLADDAERGCKYRLGDLKCVAGQLIPDDKYDPSWDDSINPVLANEGVVAEILEEAGHDPEFLRELQIVHDTSDNIDIFRDRMRKFAKDNNLEWIW